MYVIIGTKETISIYKYRLYIIIDLNYYVDSSFFNFYEKLRWDQFSL